MILYDLDGKRIPNPPTVVYRGLDTIYKPTNETIEQIFDEGNIPSKIVKLNSGKIDRKLFETNCLFSQKNIDFFTECINKGILEPEDITHILEYNTKIAYHQFTLQPTPFVSTSDSLTVSANYSGWFMSWYGRRRPSMPILVFKTDGMQGIDFGLETKNNVSSPDREIGIFDNISLNNLVQIVCVKEDFSSINKLIIRHKRKDISIAIGRVNPSYLNTNYSKPPNYHSEIKYMTKFSEREGKCIIPEIIELVSHRKAIK